MTDTRRYPCATPGCPAERMCHNANGKREPYVADAHRPEAEREALCVWCRNAVQQGRSVSDGIRRAQWAIDLDEAHTERLTPKPEPVKTAW